MKTASEIRALMMDKDVSSAPRVKSRLEGEIVKAAKRGHGFVEAFVPVEDCSLICANTIRSELLDLGYGCNIRHPHQQFGA